MITEAPPQEGADTAQFPRDINALPSPTSPSSRYNPLSSRSQPTGYRVRNEKKLLKGLLRPATTPLPEKLHLTTVKIRKRRLSEREGLEHPRSPL